MKFHPTSILLLVFLGCSITGIAADEQTEPDTQVSTARVLGDIPDGTPPAPEPAKPGFIVPAADVLATKTCEQGGRTITFREIAPIALPQPVAPALPDTDSQAFQSRIAALRENYVEQEILMVGATVFRAKDSPARSLVRISRLGGREDVTFWSSADFALLSGIPYFIGSDGVTRSTMMAWSIENTDAAAVLRVKYGLAYNAPEIPAFPVDKATFVLTSTNPPAATLAAIQSLHDLYNNEHARLQAAYEGRERARIQQEADLKANPPQPKDIVLHHWRITAPQKGATR